jgi:hypothetical protein
MREGAPSTGPRVVRANGGRVPLCLCATARVVWARSCKYTEKRLSPVHPSLGSEAEVAVEGALAVDWRARVARTEDGDRPAPWVDGHACDRTPRPNPRRWPDRPLANRSVTLSDQERRPRAVLAVDRRWC